ncbi:relaxase [Glutamicibacter sp. BW80]|uniref:relaxase/mobilization nuclease domain-containing protein n=1 Tax=Glutamicibacter sp. BW80 TaxID=2024404 RepID=UPI000BB8CE59|nr:relaxase/mobilization nuclease domain-containing protein [Glutamicibacter sp. BW80]PCC27058.1 relaxase [Glutamicibacter sp. BW80]
MMPNIVRGSRMTGLVKYLVGPGRSNEHTEPHLVAGDQAMMAWHDEAELNDFSASAIARHLDKPQKAYDVDVSGGHVWHCSLSLRADEGLLRDDQWNDIANDFIAAMEFDDNQGSKAPCRWVAVRHGVSKNGNDHIHIAVNLVREDGTKASVHNDFKRAQSATRALETKYGLEELESVQAERSTRGYNPAEREAQAAARARAKYERERKKVDSKVPAWETLGKVDRQSRISAELTVDQPRYLLSLKVRSAATASESESEFVRRMRGDGLLVRARFADGRTDVVTGYSVAERPQYGERPIWYGGGHLGRDLTLPRLRSNWPDTPNGAGEAAAEWSAAKRGRRVVSPGREATQPSPELWQKYSQELSQIVDKLGAVPLDDRATWATVARETSGALAAWSRATEPEPGDLGAAADALSRSAQTFDRTPKPQQIGVSALAGTAMLLASAAHGGQGAVAQAALIRQLLRLTQAIHDVSVATSQARQAQLLAHDTRVRLVRVRDAMPALPIQTQQRATTAVLERSTPNPWLQVQTVETKPLDTDAARAKQLMELSRKDKPHGSVVPETIAPHRTPSVVQAAKTGEKTGEVEK